MKNNILIPHYNHNGVFIRKICSFVRRGGRITKSQLYAIKKYWPLIGINFQLTPLNFYSVFNRNAPIVLEVGFGSGASLVNTAINTPEKNFLGIEVYKSGIGSCLNLAYKANIHNLKLIFHDAIEVFHNMILDRSIFIVQIFFPDPWPKKRHNKRRMIQSNFLQIISKKLIMNGFLHIITDSEEYAFYILKIIKKIKNYIYLTKKNNFFIKPITYIPTNFEKKCILQGNKIFDLIFQLKE